MQDKIYKILISDKAGAGFKPAPANFTQAYYIKGALSRPEIKKICKEILADPVTQEAHVGHLTTSIEGAVEVAYNPGVMDPWEDSLKKAIKDLGIKTEVSVKTARIYKRENALMNKVIQHVVSPGENPFPDLPEYKFKLKTITLINAGYEKLAKISRDGRLFLN